MICPYPKDLFEVEEWCSEYVQTSQNHITDPVRRFMIGFYQVYQGSSWSGTDSQHESNAAVVIHMILTARLLDLCLLYIPIKGSHNALFHLSRAAQHIVYATNPDHYQRKKRYSPVQLTKDLDIVCRLFDDMIPEEVKPEAYNNAMKIMSGRL